MKLATWNVNSVRQRERHVANWLERHQPDLLLLQEIKCEEPQFPALAFPGYTAHVVGQKSYNGVAILARVPVTVNHRALPGLPAEDAQARYIEVEAAGVTVGNLYLPNGNSGGEAGYAYKLNWMHLLAERARVLLEQDKPCVFAGDYNVAPTDEDFAPGTLPANDALVRPETRAAFRTMLWHGLTDAVRALQPRGRVYTFWDYQAGAWRRDAGLRIDHALLSPDLAERLVSATPDRNERAQEQPSDHVPLIVELAGP
ncbi:MAG: exodeoxyribonuclease III [Janthinobacterium lividum]